jgi:tyrosyl-tRNA synthetase
MPNPYHIFQERGFIYQCTDDENLPKLFDQERVTAYIGFDATATSFHVGTLVPILALKWLQECGHRPVALVGGGTTMIGDPSGKTEARRMLSRQDIKSNMEGLKQQLARFIRFGPDQALMIDNGDWLLGLNYIDFLRDIGKHFSVNRMLSFESYKMRLETGLTFIEFNYQVLQAYDFLVLYQRERNKLQMGGQDQWGNIVAGSELIRRVTGGQAYGLTFPLLQDPKTGAKFGKTHQGAVWLDPELTSPFDYYQFWRNVEDEELTRLLSLFTFLPMDEVRRLGSLEGNLINRAKEILAYEVTALTHGAKAAEDSMYAAFIKFGAVDPDGRVETSSAAPNRLPEGFQTHSGPDQFGVQAEAVPQTELDRARIESGLSAIDLFTVSGLCKSKGDARRLIRQGGAAVNEIKVDQEDREFTVDDLIEDGLTLKAGKKRYHRLVFV